MNLEVSFISCKRFKNVWEWFPDELDDQKKYQLKNDEHLKTYCDNENCNTYIDKINSGSLYFFNEFFGNSSVFASVAKNNINIVEYIMIWLSYMLSLKNDNSISYINYFYDDYISKDKYTNSIGDVEAYTSYNDLINKKQYMTKMNIKDISKFYDAFKLLCEMYTGFDTDNSNCTNCSEKASQFVEKYEKLHNDYNSNEDSSYKEILCTLSTDYDNLKKKCNDVNCSNSSSFPTIDKTKIPEKCSKQISGHISEVTSSSSSIASKLIPVLSIIVAVAILLGISYKVNNKELKNIIFIYYFHYIYANYSLCGIRKRAQKHLREKLKK
ncbi:hypothetical protein YYC_02839 [Plasmodium yoelii 17X]|uniref:Uncharacterized protein n=1 Tax=Plasmodium yoelii 17X TaxID=1323249 RepID=V7PID8_PLAYE|nr:hypothetical protein YYC_02839 [Plasmodium yoelii 17X]